MLMETRQIQIWVAYGDWLTLQYRKINLISKHLRLDVFSALFWLLLQKNCVKGKDIHSIYGHGFPFILVIFCSYNVWNFHWYNRMFVQRSSLCLKERPQFIESELIQTTEMHFILRVVDIVAKDRKSLQNGHCLGTVLFNSVFRVKKEIRSVFGITRRFVYN